MENPVTTWLSSLLPSLRTQLSRVRENGSRRDYVIAGLALLIVAGGFTWQLGDSDSVQLLLVSGFPQPFDVHVDGRSVRVVAGARQRIEVAPGPHEISVTGADGKPVEHHLLMAPRGQHTVVYNVGGAAPLFTYVVSYGAHGTGGETPPRFLGGHPIAVEGTFDHVFEDPPRSISMSSSTPVVYRSVLTTAPGDWRHTLNLLLREKHLPLAAETASRIVAMLPGDEMAAGMANWVMERAFGSGASVPLLRAMTRRQPTIDELNVFQWALVRAGQEDELSSSANQRDGDKDPVAALMLRMNTVGHDEAVRLLDQARALRPDDPTVLSRSARFALLDGKWAVCVRDLEPLSKLPEAVQDAGELAQCLVAQGLIGEAREKVDALARKQPHNGVLATLAQLFYLEGDPQGWVSRVDSITKGEAKDKRNARTDIKLRAGQPADPDELAALDEGDDRTTDEILDEAGRDPARAWSLVNQASTTALGHLTEEANVLLAAEFLRAGDRDAAAALLEGGNFRFPLRVIRDYVLDGREHFLLWRIDPAERAALDFVRARHLATLGRAAESDALKQQAKRRDLLHSVVTRALLTWPAPARATGGLVLRRKG